MKPILEVGAVRYVIISVHTNSSLRYSLCGGDSLGRYSRDGCWARAVEIRNYSAPLLLSSARCAGERRACGECRISCSEYVLPGTVLDHCAEERPGVVV